jgi:leader peptidase (prepilin peptidase)/N-methyltransferase
VSAELPAGFEIIAAALLGAAIGSFLNVCILRWGAEPKQSVVRPRSRCPRCGRGLAWYDNIPVVSWLLLRARCRACGEPISVLYPLVELATAGIWAFIVWRYGVTVEALRAGIFATILLGIAVTDAREYIIPHEFSIGGTILAILLAAWTDPSHALVSLQGALLGAGTVLLIGELSGLALGQEAMGGGDCALMGMIGAFLGWEAVFPVLLLGAVISTLIFLVSALRPIRPAREVTSDLTPLLPETTPPKLFRWGLVARLCLAGLAPLVILAIAIVLGFSGEVLIALFHGLLGAGAAYYAAFLLPSSLGDRWWMRVAGLSAAALAIALGAGVSPARIAVGLLLGALVLLLARRTRLVASPETTAGLQSEGYLPYGVGLTIAAGMLLFSGAMPMVRDVVLEYGRLLRLA